MTNPYLVWGIAVVLVAAGLLAVALLRRDRKEFREPDMIQSWSIILVVLGIVFGDDRLIGYAFIGAGVSLAILSMILRPRRGEPSRTKP